MNYKHQINSHSCAPAALGNALLRCGVNVSLRRLGRMCKVTKRMGADEFKLAIAADQLGFCLTPFRCFTPALARDTVRAHLRVGTPILLCVDRDTDGVWAHWITVVHATSRHAWIADSARGYGPVLKKMSWRRFLARAMTVHAVNETRFYLHILTKKAT